MSIARLDRLRLAIQPLREQLIHHRVYSMVNTAERLRLFMEYHIFAVWDFMSLLKCLQRSQTCVSLPWTPTSRPTVARFVNEIVLGEESDEDGNGGYTSHFDLYRRAMRESGASTAGIDRLTDYLGSGSDLNTALLQSGVGRSVEDFVRTTWTFIDSAPPHSTAAAFTFGREDVIPDMFRRFVDTLAGDRPGQFQQLKYYLVRHIDVDENSHAPLAVRAICELCGDDDRHWQEATTAAKHALQARIRLWDAIVEAMPPS